MNEDDIRRKFVINYRNEEYLKSMDDKLKPLVSIIQKNSDWLEILKKDPYNLRIRENPKRSNQFIFSYDMIKSDMSLPEVQVSRGLVLNVSDIALFDRSKNYREDEVEYSRIITVVIRGFDKFFNHGESNAAIIDWNGPVFVFEKMDGSLIKYTSLDNVDHNTGMRILKPLWTTNNSFDASGELPGDIICEYETFQDLINAATSKWDKEILKIILNFGNRLTFLFELVSPFNRIVVPYKDVELYWLSCRCKLTGKEFLPEDLLNEYPLDIDTSAIKLLLSAIKQPKRYRLDHYQMDEIKDLVSTMTADNEGVVIVDQHFNRVKVKSEAYLAIHRLKDGNGQLSMEHLLKCIQNETVDDIMGLFPEYFNKIQEVVNLYKNVDNRINEVFELFNEYVKSIDASEDEKIKKKNFAMKFKDNVFSRILFDLYKFGPEKFQELKADFLKNVDYERLNELSV